MKEMCIDKTILDLRKLAQQTRELQHADAVTLGKIADLLDVLADKFVQFKVLGVDYE